MLVISKKHIFSFCRIFIADKLYLSKHTTNEKGKGEGQCWGNPNLYKKKGNGKDFLKTLYFTIYHSYKITISVYPLL